MHVDSYFELDDLPPSCILDCSASGRVDDAVEYWRKELSFTVNRENAIACLGGYGAWDEAELAQSTDDQLARRILWLACTDFNEWNFSKDNGSDLFSLEL